MLCEVCPIPDHSPGTQWHSHSLGEKRVHSARTKPESPWYAKGENTSFWTDVTPLFHA